MVNHILADRTFVNENFEVVRLGLGLQASLKCTEAHTHWKLEYQARALKD